MADYFNVSADYLLAGQTARRGGYYPPEKGGPASGGPTFSPKEMA